MTGGGEDWVSALQTVLAALDYPVLADLYCEQGGEAFWQAKRPEVEELGLLWARALGRRLSRGGRSLYAGAGVAELPAMLFEVLELDRAVAAANLRGRECEVLARALQAAGLADRLQVQHADAGELAAAGGFDHLSAVSLLDDPETWPWLSGVTYGRIHPVALDVEAFCAEREAARGLVRRLVAGLELPAWITTTAEEVAFYLEHAEGLGVRVEADDDLVETAVVGDPIGFLHLVSADRSRSDSSRR